MRLLTSKKPRQTRRGLGEWRIAFLFSRAERVDRVEILCKILDLIHQLWTVDLLQKGLTLLLKGVFVKCNFMITPKFATTYIPISLLPSSALPRSLSTRSTCSTRQPISLLSTRFYTFYTAQTPPLPHSSPHPKEH